MFLVETGGEKQLLETISTIWNQEAKLQGDQNRKAWCLECAVPPYGCSTEESCSKLGEMALRGDVSTGALLEEAGGEPAGCPAGAMPSRAWQTVLRVCLGQKEGSKLAGKRTF